MNHPELLRPEEAAALLGVSERTLIRWAAMGGLTDVRTLTRRHRYLTSEILAIRNRAS